MKDQVSTCQTCHMPAKRSTTPDYGAEQGKLASHRWLGANTVLSKYYGYDEQMQKTIAFLQTRGSQRRHLFGIERNGGKMIAPLGSEAFDVAAGDVLTVSVVIQNKGIAHTLVPEQRDFYECWVEFQAKDAAGNTLMDSGAIEPDGDLDPRAHSFTNRLVNVQGHAERSAPGVGLRGSSPITTPSPRAARRLCAISSRCPADATGPITITAKVNYRRFNQHFIDFGMGKHYEMPVVEMASRTRTLTLGPIPPRRPIRRTIRSGCAGTTTASALLDAQQYAESARAFEHVAQLRPDYADAYTNIAIADFSWQRYDASRTNLEKALKLAPHNARALYYLALVERIQGHLDAAIADLLEVISAVPALARCAPRAGLLVLSAAQIR